MVSAFSEAREASEQFTFKRTELSEDEGSIGAGQSSPGPIDVITRIATNDAANEAVNHEQESDPGSDPEDADIYVVERIVKHRKTRKTKAVEYLIRWEGYGTEDDTWEPHDNIAESASALVDSYWSPIGGYQAYTADTASPASTKRKRVSNSADVLTTNTMQSKRRKQVDAEEQETVGRVSLQSQDHKNSESTQSLKTNWSPPLELKSWESLAVVDTMEKDDHNELFIFLEWPKDKERSRHKAAVVYQKLPQSMLRFFEAHLVFKPAKMD